MNECKVTNPLIGPVTLHILEKGDSKIVLFGDYHVRESKCSISSSCGQTIDVYLKRLFDTYLGKEYIDLFLEYEFTPKVRMFQKGATFKNYVAPVISTFDDCFNKTKQCPYSRVRFHYADVRSGVIHSQTDQATKEVVKELQDLHRSFFVTGRLRPRNVKFMLSILNKHDTLNVDYFFKLAKIDKQLKAIKDEQITQFVYDAMIQYMRAPELNTLKEQIDQFTFDYLMAHESKQPFIDNPENDPYGDLMVLLSPLFDLYTITRILKHNMKQVIVYAGNAHIQNMRHFFLQRLGYKETVSLSSMNAGKDFQCLNLTNVPQPLFS
jgi:hypothetical protein